MSSSGPSTFVEESVAIAPTWLQGPVGQSILLSMAIQYDGLASAAEAAIYAGLPGVAPTDALPWACADRQIDPGPNESTTHLEGRLGQWLVRSRYYGTPTGIILALLGYTDPNYPDHPHRQQHAAVRVDCQHHDLEHVQRRDRSLLHGRVSPDASGTDPQDASQLELGWPVRPVDRRPRMVASVGYHPVHGRHAVARIYRDTRRRFHARRQHDARMGRIAERSPVATEPHQEVASGAQYGAKHHCVLRFDSVRPVLVVRIVHASGWSLWPLEQGVYLDCARGVHI